MQANGTGFYLAITMLVVLAAVGLYDLYALWHLDTQDTVSHHMRAWSVAFPGLPMLIGFVLGHLFYPIPGARE